MKNRIAIFQYDFSIQSYTKNLIISLAEAGYEVDFYTNCNSFNQSFVSIKELENNKSINIHILGEFSSNKPLIITQKIFRRLKNIYSDNYIDQNFLKFSIESISGDLENYLCLIGIEKKGLVWAGKISKVLDIPFIYYSLELYIEDHPSFASFKKDRDVEIYYHQKAKATIIQDKFRAEVLFKYNNLETDLIFLPVSVKGKIIQKRERYLQEKFNIPSESNIGLYFGIIAEGRYCRSLAEISERLECNYLVFHGYLAHKDLEDLRKMPHVVLSTDLMDENEKVKIISSAHIGISLYRNFFSNDRLTAFSSEKVALYMQSGLPIISFRNESYEELFNNYKCGEMIDSVDDFPSAFQKVRENYEMYREECFKAFYKYYSYENNVNSLLRYLESLRSFQF